jgi:hypothetical protein
MTRGIRAAVLALAAATGLAACGNSTTPAGSPPAPVTSTPSAPVTKVVADDVSWHFTTRPGTIYVGQGGAPIALRLTWSSWTATSATATGRLDLWKPGCTPIARCKPATYKVTVWLHHVASHQGTSYFSRMRYSYGHRGKVIYWTMRAKARYGNGVWWER